MKLDKAIEYFENEVQFCKRAPAGNIAHGNSDFTRIMDASQTALEALREKQQRENPTPLNQEELRDMIGKPVWLVNESAGCGRWVIMSVSWLNISYAYKAYRYKPEEVCRNG